MTIYLRMLPLSLERDDTMWRRVDDSWWSFLFAWCFPFLASLASWAVHELLVSYIASFLSHPFVMSSFFSSILISWSLLSTHELVLLKIMKAGIFCLIRGVLLPASYQHPSLSLRKTQCYVVFGVAHSMSICLSTSSAWFIFDMNSSLDQIGFESFLQALVQQNIQCLQKQFLVQ